MACWATTLCYRSINKESEHGQNVHRGIRYNAYLKYFTETGSFFKLVKMVCLTSTYMCFDMLNQSSRSFYSLSLVHSVVSIL